MLKIIDNPDIEAKNIAEKSLQRMQQIYGQRYCPCALEQGPDTLCICKKFREQDYEGECHCGRYKKVDL